MNPIAWQKSSYSLGENNCVELAQWHKSTHSGAANNCLELAQAPSRIAVRDSKTPDRSPLVFTRAAFHAFLTSVKAGEFDR